MKLNLRRLIYILSAVLLVLLLFAVILTQCSKDKGSTSAPATTQQTETPESTPAPSESTPESVPPTDPVATNPEPSTGTEPSVPQETTPEATTPESTEPETPQAAIKGAISSEEGLQNLYKNFFCEYSWDGDNSAFGIFQTETEQVIYIREENGTETIYETKNGVFTSYVRLGGSEQWKKDPSAHQGNVDERLDYMACMLLYTYSKGDDLSYGKVASDKVAKPMEGVQYYGVYSGETVVGYLGMNPDLNICVYEETSEGDFRFLITDVSVTGWACPEYTAE